jgi:8-amino-7-oxononanoate synthase
VRYRHADAEDAGRLADEHSAGLALLATDGVFSMDGDVAPLAQLAQVARRHDAWLLVDDAHGLGVLGAQGGGALELAGLTADDVPLLVGTLGKAIGTFGAFVAGDRDVVELILQRARSYIYTTALPPAVAAATRAAQAIVRGEGWRRERLGQRVAQFRAGGARRGQPLLPSLTAIQPVAVAGAARCLAASLALQRRGFWGSAIRHPTVPAGTERLRVTLSAAHTVTDVDSLLDALAETMAALEAL